MLQPERPTLLPGEFRASNPASICSPTMSARNTPTALEQIGARGAPSTRHSYTPSTLLHAPVHRSEPFAQCDLRARPADDSAALGTHQHPRLPDVDEAWPEARANQLVASARPLYPCSRSMRCASCARDYAHGAELRAGGPQSTRLPAMAAAPRSCPRWRPRPCHSRRPSPVTWDPLVEQLKLDRSTLLQRVNAAHA